MNKYSSERKRLQAQGQIPEWLYLLCHDRFQYSQEVKGLLIRKTGQWRGKIGNRPGSLLPNNRRVISIKSKRYYEHIIVWLMFNGEVPSLQIDHINCDPTDNRIENLRLATNQQNSQNRLLQSNSTTGFKGVSLRKDLIKRPFQAHIKSDGVVKNLGYFSSAIEAAKAYDIKARELFGNFARLNFEDSYV